MRPVFFVVAAIAVVAALLAWGRWLAGRHWSATGHLLLSTGCAAILAAGWPLATCVAAYEPWWPDQPVAELFFEQTGSRRYRLTLTHLPAGRMQAFELAGDQWRLDLRTLEWSARTAALGPQSRYRIERIATRATGAGPPAVVHEFADAGAALPRLASVPDGHGAPLLRATDVAGPWQPMADGARFALRLTAAGEVAAEPRNAAASDSRSRR